MDICPDRQAYRDTDGPADDVSSGIPLGRSETIQLATDLPDFAVLEEEGSHAVYGSRHPARTWRAALACFRAGTVYQTQPREIGIDPVYVNAAIVYLVECHANRTSSHSSSTDIAGIDTANNHTRSGAGVGDSPVTLADIDKAHAIYRSPARDRIDALCLAGATVQYIASHEHHAEATITAYVELFFNLKAVGSTFFAKHATFFGIFPYENMAASDLTPRKFRMMVGLRFGTSGLNRLDGIPIIAAELRVIENKLMAMEHERGLIAALTASSRRQDKERQSVAPKAPKEKPTRPEAEKTHTDSHVDTSQTGVNVQASSPHTVDQHAMDDAVMVPLGSSGAAK